MEGREGDKILNSIFFSLLGKLADRAIYFADVFFFILFFKIF